MLEHLTQEASRSCVLIQFRNLNNSMFGYRVFRTNDYFPVNWLRVRNPLHSMEKTEDRGLTSVAYASDKKRTQEWSSQSRGSTYRGRDTRFLTDAAQDLFLPHTQTFPGQRFFPPHEQYVNQRTTGKNIRCEIQRENHWRFCLYLFGRRRIPLVFGRNEKDITASSISGCASRLESIGRRTPTGIPPHGIYGCRTSVP